MTMKKPSTKNIIYHENRGNGKGPEIKMEKEKNREADKRSRR
jgi:hypothetical protein